MKWANDNLDGYLNFYSSKFFQIDKRKINKINYIYLLFLNFVKKVNNNNPVVIYKKDHLFEIKNNLIFFIVLCILQITYPFKIKGIRKKHKKVFEKWGIECFLKLSSRIVLKKVIKGYSHLNLMYKKIIDRLTNTFIWV